MSVFGSDREDISGTTLAIFANFYACCQRPVARFSYDMFTIGTIGRIAYRREGVLCPLKCIRPIGRERGMLSTIALFVIKVCHAVVSI